MLASTATTAYVWSLVQQTLATQNEDTAVTDQEVGMLPILNDTSAETQHGSIQEEVLEAENVSSATLVNTVPETGITISSEILNDSQKAILETLGVDINALVITPEMVQCAEEKVGVQRMQEIVDGATPSMFEAVSIASCV